VSGLDRDAGSAWETVGLGKCRSTFQWKTLTETFAFENRSDTLEDLNGFNREVVESADIDP
jgi:hypothetical protein